MNQFNWRKVVKKTKNPKVSLDKIKKDVELFYGDCDECYTREVNRYLAMEANDYGWDKQELVNTFWTDRF